MHGQQNSKKILLHVSKFVCHHQGVLHLCLAKLHKFLKLKLFHKIIKIIKILIKIIKIIKIIIKISIKILFNRCLETQQNLFDVIISCASSVYL